VGVFRVGRLTVAGPSAAWFPRRWGGWWLDLVVKTKERLATSRETAAGAIYFTYASARISGHPAATADGTRVKGVTHAVGLRAGYLISSTVGGVTGILSEWTCFEA